MSFNDIRKGVQNQGVKMVSVVSRRTSGFCGILGPILALLFIFLSISLHSWFSWPDNALSDLGALETSYNWVFNLGLALSGTAGFVFSLGLLRSLDRKVGVGGTIVFGVGMLFLILIGVFPSGTSPHVSVSIAFYSLCAIGMLIIGIDQLRVKSDRVWGVFTLSVLFLAIGTLILIRTIPYTLGAAIPESIGAIAISEFSISFGARFLGLI